MHGTFIFFYLRISIVIPIHLHTSPLLASSLYATDGHFTYTHPTQESLEQVKILTVLIDSLEGRLESQIKATKDLYGMVVVGWGCVLVGWGATGSIYVPVHLPFISPHFRTRPPHTLHPFPHPYSHSMGS